MADKIYFLPVTSYFVEKVIEKERPDGIMLAFGGQTALNCGVELHDAGVFEKYNIKVLGTQIDAIKNTEDRDLFIKKLNEINLKMPESEAANSVEESVKVAEKLGYPVMLRVAYALGGAGSGVAWNEEELLEKSKRAFAYSSQVLVEKYLGGWKEIEYEVVRDSYDNCITVCNMENFDPMGIHTGESIVVAPSQTLTNSEYHKLRAISIQVIRHLGIVGECNIQFALDPYSEDYRIIEVNARLSRSSALASKATGYPLAFVAAKLALGSSLADIENKITKATKSCFEPALDYIVIKMPRWDLQKFKRVSFEIGSEMKSVGEGIAIGRKFEEVIQKAIRMLSINLHGLVGNKIEFSNVEKELKAPTDKRLLAIVEALKMGLSIERIYELTNIDKWFLYKIRNVVRTEEELLKYGLGNVPKDLLRRAKQQGFSDFQIAKILFKEDKDGMVSKKLEVRKLRKKHGIIPVVKQIDTLAAEYPAKTNYLYLTYNGEEDDIKFTGEKSAVVLGSGAYRIGSSVEFDWCCVNAVFALAKLGYTTIMINYNPETVSTDYDVCDKLYFDELSFERVLDIYEKENPEGVIISMGGQIPNNLAMRLHKQNVRILGTSPLSIDNAENRHKFSKLLDDLKIDQPEWTEAKSMDEAEKFAENAGYPVLIRPSYVLSGAAMSIASGKKELEQYLQKAVDVSKEHPVVISKFITDAKEIEIDAVAQGGELVIYAISEHIENAGVHSGDATIVHPPQKVYMATEHQMLHIMRTLAKALMVTGPLNIQFLVKENRAYVIEMNLRASRTFPFISKVTGVNFAEKICASFYHKCTPVEIPYLNYVAVKSPQFSFSRLEGADPVLRVEMSSTGEVACFGADLGEALRASVIASTMSAHGEKKAVLLSLGGALNKERFLESAQKLAGAEFVIYATEATCAFLRGHGIGAELVHKEYQRKKPDVVGLIRDKEVGFVVNVSDETREPEQDIRKRVSDGYLIRRASADNHTPLFTDLQLARAFVDALTAYPLEKLQIKSWREYMGKTPVG